MKTIMCNVTTENEYVGRERNAQVSHMIIHRHIITPINLFAYVDTPVTNG